MDNFQYEMVLVGFCTTACGKKKHPQQVDDVDPWPTTQTANAALTHSQWSRQTRLAKDFGSKWEGGIAYHHHFIWICFSFNEGQSTDF